MYFLKRYMPSILYSSKYFLVIPLKTLGNLQLSLTFVKYRLKFKFVTIRNVF